MKPSPSEPANRFAKAKGSWGACQIKMHRLKNSAKEEKSHGESEDHWYRSWYHKLSRCLHGGRDSKGYP